MMFCHRYRRSWSTWSVSLLSLVAIVDGGIIYHAASTMAKLFPPAPSKCSAFVINCSQKDLTMPMSSLERHRWRRKESPRLSGACPRSRKRCQFRISAYNEGGSRSEGGRGGGKWPGSPKKRRPLRFLAETVNAAVLEMCVQSQGRPLAIAITDLVERSVEAFVCGYSIEALLLELQLLDSTSRVPGETLTGVEKRYRTQWVRALHAVMQYLNLVEQREPKTSEELHLKNQVDVVLRGRQTRDEQIFVKFDKALATGGISGGIATECIVIAPQMVPISQLVLLAIRALQKLEDAAAQ